MQTRSPSFNRTPKKRRKQKTNLENNNNNAKLRFSQRENVLRKNVLLTKLNISY
jgi:hypothetical protein